MLIKKLLCTHVLMMTFQNVIHFSDHRLFMVKIPTSAIICADTSHVCKNVFLVDRSQLDNMNYSKE